MQLPLFCGLAMLTGVSTVLLVVAEARHSAVGRWLWKALASFAFVGAGIAHLGRAPTHFDEWVMVGLVLSLIGDLLLVDARTFLPGLGSFLLGHVAFSVAFLFRGVSLSGALIGAVPVAVVIVAVAVWLLPYVEKKMKGPVVAYMAVISSMVALSIGSWVARPDWLVVAAATAFFLSDFAVARDRFVKKSIINRAWGLPVYYGAQILFACAIGHG